MHHRKKQPFNIFFREQMSSVLAPPVKIIENSELSQLCANDLLIMLDGKNSEILPYTEAHCCSFPLLYDPPCTQEDLELWIIEFVNKLADITRTVFEFTYTFYEGDIFIYNHSNNKCLCYLIYLGLICFEPCNTNDLSTIEGHIATIYGYYSVCWPDIIRQFVLPMYISDIQSRLSPAISQFSLSSED